MPEFNPQQFRQNSFDGFGERPLRPYRAPRASRPAAGPQPAAPAASSWSQPALPDPPAAPAAPARPARLTPAAQSRADINTARAEARAARVATAQANAATATHRQSQAQARASQAQQRAAQARRTALSGIQAGPVHGPQTHAAFQRSQPASAVPDNTPPPPSATPSGPGRQVRINQLAYRAQGLRLGAPPPSAAAPSAGPTRPTTPPRPAAPPSAGPARPGGAVSPGLARAGRTAAVGTFVAAKAMQSLQRPATDPKRSGNPLYKTNTGWTKS